MDLMQDEGLKKSVIDQMMGELGDVTSKGLKRSEAPVKGVEIAITVSPKSGDDEKGEAEEHGAACMDADCDDPMHDHSERDAEKPESSDYINDLLKKLG